MPLSAAGCQVFYYIYKGGKMKKYVSLGAFRAYGHGQTS